MRSGALLVLAALAACTRLPQGEASRLHPTIVSLNPCSDAVLAEVAAPGQLLAISHYSHDPASSSMDLAMARRFRATSGTVEEIAALRPDLVIADAFLPPATASALAELGIPVERLPVAKSVDASKAQVLRLAALAGQDARGAAMVLRIDRALSRAAPAEGAMPVSAVVWQSGGIVAGGNSLIADLLRAAGFRNLAAARGMGQADLLPLEVMLADPPQVILAAGSPASGEDRMLAHPALAALKNTRRESFDAALLWCGGPTIVRAAQRLTEVRNAS
jgi:iron complex transport system substrate-binding protein